MVGLSGIWLHELVGLDFAHWLSPELHIWMIEKIKELLHKPEVQVHPGHGLDLNFGVIATSRLGPPTWHASDWPCQQRHRPLATTVRPSWLRLRVQR